MEWSTSLDGGTNGSMEPPPHPPLMTRDSNDRVDLSVAGTNVEHAWVAALLRKKWKCSQANSTASGVTLISALFLFDVYIFGTHLE